MLKKQLSKLETMLEKDAKQSFDGGYEPAKIYYGSPKLPKNLIKQPKKN